MRKIIVSEFITLDGVMQAPGGPEEDPSGDFEFGGWSAPYGDEISGEIMQKQMEPADLLLGRKTFEIFANYWPQHADYWPGINDVTKYVLSTTMKESDWQNSIFLETVEDIKNLKKQESGSPASKSSNLIVWGSSELVQLLLQNDLVDEMWLKIHPLTLGKGKKLFKHGTMPAAFTITESVVTPGGVILANYKRAGEVKTGTVGA